MQNMRMGKKTLKAFVCWSGGKDSALTLYRAKKEGVKVMYLLNMLAEDRKFSRSHGLPSGILREQAERIGIPILQCPSSWKEYERKFKDKVFELKKEGIDAGIFGDIDLEEHRRWVERVCRDTGIKPLLPLWGEDRERLLKDFIKVGFRAILVTVNLKFLDERWLGREVNQEFIEDLKTLGGIDLCGEKGEYHTFVFDGPIFKEKLKFFLGKKIFKDNYCFLEIKKPFFFEGGDGA
mgnify:FL=1